MNGDVVLIKGDGVGQEIVNQAIKSLKSIERKYSHKFYLNEYLMGESAYNVYKKTLPDDTLAACKKCKNILFGVVGSPTLDLDEEKKPVKALFGLRKELDLFTDLRPIRIDKRLSHQALLKEEYIQNGVDILVVRELTAGLYFGDHIIEGEGLFARAMVHENEHLDGHIYTEKVIGNVYNAGDAEAERAAEIAAGLPVEEEN